MMAGMLFLLDSVCRGFGFRVSAAAVLRQSVSEVSSPALAGETVISTSRADFPGIGSVKNKIIII
jgi:hypothetical protein